MNHVAKRTVTALITASLAVAGFVFLPIEVAVPILVFMVALVHIEFTQIVRQRHEIMPKLGVATGIAVMTAILYDVPLLLLAVGAVWARFLFCKADSPISALGTTLFGVLYIPFMLTWLIKIPLEYGMEMLFYVVAIIKISDMGGFAFGMAFGKHKMCPSISPGKSWEGLAGSVFGSVLISCLFIPLTRFSWCEAMGFGVLAALVGTFGDLVESRIKRECGVKDSATFMPAGLGGFLDMFDSLVFAPALFYLLLD